MTQVYAFTITITGSGDTVDEAWDSAVEGARLDKIDGNDLEHELVEDDEDGVVSIPISDDDAADELPAPWGTDEDDEEPVAT